MSRLQANHLGNVAYRTGRRIEWDTEKLIAKGCPAADSIRREYRPGWKLVGADAHWHTYVASALLSDIERSGNHYFKRGWFAAVVTVTASVFRELPSSCRAVSIIWDYVAQ